MEMVDGAGSPIFGTVSYRAGNQHNYPQYGYED
jgi:hypothetical protein